METKIKDRIINYWTKRSENFAQLRQEELYSYMSELTTILAPILMPWKISLDKFL